MSRHSVFKGISRIIRKRSSMRSLSFSLLAVGLGSIGGLRPIGRPPSSFLSLSVQPSILIALLLGWNIIGDRRDGRPALQLLLASFDVEESAAQEAGRGSGYPPPPLYGRNARYPRYFRVEKLHLAALSLSLSPRFHIDWRIPSSIP